MRPNPHHCHHDIRERNDTDNERILVHHTANFFFTGAKRSSSSDKVKVSGMINTLRIVVSLSKICDWLLEVLPKYLWYRHSNPLHQYGLYIPKILNKDNWRFWRILCSDCQGEIHHILTVVMLEGTLRSSSSKTFSIK